MLTLTITTETYSRTPSGKSWRSKPDSIETETLPWYDGGEDKHHKIACDDTLRWFRRIGGSEHAVRSYTPAGYIVTRLVSTNPDRTVRIVQKFHVTNAT